MRFLKHLTIGRRRRPVASLPELVTALGESAAYLAQGAAYSYLRARSGTMGPRLMQDPGFAAAAERCKWEAFAAMAADLVLIAEGEMRRAGASVPEGALLDLYEGVLGAQKIPEHRAGTGWADYADAFARRVPTHLADAKPSIAAIAANGAGILLAHAPVEEAIRRADREMVTNNVTFRVIDQVENLRRRADFGALGEALEKMHTSRI